MRGAEAVKIRACPKQEVDGIKLTNFIFLRENPSQSAKDLLGDMAGFVHAFET